MSCVTETERCMVTVFDPVNKKGYDMAFNPGSANTEIFPTIGLQIYFDQKRMGGCKRVFLCKKFQAKICRANETCNSIHACRKRVCEMRKLYPCAENERCVRIISKGDGECFEVPVSKIHETAGSADAAEAPAAAGATGAAGTASEQPRHVLCSDFENKSCMKGALCPRIHVDPRHLHSLRALWGVPCCGDVACPSGTSVQTMHPLFARTEQWTTFCIQRSQALPKDHLACTKGLLELCSVGSASGASVSKGCLTVPAAKLCRPHLRRQCKWGMECNNVHLCRLRLPNGVTAMPQSGSAGVQAQQASPKLQTPQAAQQAKKAGGDEDDTPKSQQQRQQTQMQLQQATVAALMQAQHLQQMQQLQGQLLLQQAAAMQLRNLQLAMPVGAGAELGATLSPTHTASSTFQSAAPSAVTSPRSQLHALPSFISASGSSASDEDVAATDRSTTDSLNSSAAAFTPSIQNAAAALMAQQQRSAIEAAAAQMVAQQQQVQQQLNPVAFQNAAAAAAAFPAGMLPEGRSPLLSMLSSFQAASLPCGGVNH